MSTDAADAPSSPAEAATTRAARLVDSLVDPRSVVVVGASADPGKSSSRPLQYLARYGYAGDVIAVNPRRGEVFGFPAVADIADIPQGSLDAAVVNLAAPAVTSALRQLDRRGVTAAVVIGSGFERDDSRPRHELLEFLRGDHRIRVIGPNCVGTMSTRSAAHLNFSSVLQTTEPRIGSVALVTQSGATGNGILMSLLRRGVGISHWFSTGNELDTGALEIAAGLLQRDDVSCIGLFLEAITDIGWLPVVTDLLASTGKRIYAVKIADSDLGQAAAGGHTGRVVGSADVSRVVLREAGLTRVANIAELCDCLVLDQVTGRPRPAPRVSVASVSGASAVIVADGIHAAQNLDLATWDRTLTRRLTEQSDNRIEHPLNPLDVPFLGETRTFANLVTSISESPQTDVTVAVESSLAHDRDELIEVFEHRAETASPIVLTHLSEDDAIHADALARLASARVAVIPTPDRAVHALSLLSTSGPDAPAGAAPTGTEASGAVAADRAGVRQGAPDRRTQGLERLRQLLPADFSWSDFTVAADLAAARRAAAGFGFPVVVKAAGRTIAHRSELGAVAFVKTPDELPAAFGRIAAVCESEGDAVIVQAAAPAGQEILVAGLRDPEYGAAAIVRLGGVFVELLDEQVVVWGGWPPARRRDIVRRSRIGVLLAGYRGRPAGDVDALCEVIDTVLATIETTDLVLLELNPVLVLTNGVRAVDALAYDLTNRKEHA